MKAGIIGILMLCAAPCAAQSPTDIASHAMTAVSLALDTKASFDCPDRKRCLIMQAIRDGGGIAISEIIKRIHPSQRPCAPQCGWDGPNNNMPSEDTVLSFVGLPKNGSSGASFAFSISIGVGTATGRVAAGKHTKTAVLIGAAIGSALSRIR